MARRKSNIPRYADDTVILTSSAEELEHMIMLDETIMNMLDTVSREYGLHKWSSSTDAEISNRRNEM